ncbi:MAG: glycogen debranching protein GlgX [Nitrospirae bacterium]|nr:glycogen debranching protein GlgX [Nitrospirota bacterium]MBF0535379.1 glycogen debranching protein GlgX [Nitrospirota bacterium]MBF0616899.1 glycogen debranching protein GlgX [Nitrospirota bacterium]
MAQYMVERGKFHPLGMELSKDGANFSLYSRYAKGVQLLLFNNHDDPDPVQIITFDPQKNKTFFFWHVFIRGLNPGMHYALRVDGDFNLQAGLRFNPKKVVLDPYALGNTCNLWNRANACGSDDNLKTSMRSVIIDINDYDWEGDKPLNHDMADTIIYEIHVGGFTRSPSSGVKNPGKFAGIVEKIPYLKELGVTAVELLPVMQFDDSEGLRTLPDGTRLSNYWGYSTVNFFAPHPAYCISPEDGLHIKEFRDMVKALHKADIEVIMDVVFNHTDEGDQNGPTFSFKGIDNGVYYYLSPQDKQYYMNYSGCGNTVNCNQPIVTKFIVECLEHWVKDMHVDGFRFDEGTILSRGTDGARMSDPPVLWEIQLSEVMADTKIIAEAWDAGGLYEVGDFPGYRCAAWNGRYRDDIRSFVKGDAGIVGNVASRVAGSSDLFQYAGRLPINGISFVVCHDGFTLNDLVSYNEKHNWKNGENNKDGIDNNLSWNCGVEGQTNDANVENLRQRQIRNFTAIQFLSQGVPMILAGDEVRRTQNGNNNAYCQDNALNWFDWNLTKNNGDLLRFFRLMIAFRRKHAALHRSDFFNGSVNERGVADISWHGCSLNSPNWNDPMARALAFTLGGFGGDDDLHVMMNMYWEPLSFEIPIVRGRQWYRVIDTSKPSPNDIVDEGKEVKLSDNSYLVEGRGVVVLMSKIIV